jgi:hypothetical protein
MYNSSGRKLTGVSIVSALSLSITVGFFTIVSYAGAQNMTSVIPLKSATNDSTAFNDTLTLSIKNGTIEPTNCFFDRGGNCRNDYNGIVYVNIRDGTATLPQHFGNKNYSLIGGGFAVLPTNKNSTLGGIVEPTNCHFNRIGDCYDDINGIVYVWIDKGTATLPGYYTGDRNYSVREGYAVLPLK